MEIIIATRNAKKSKELKQLLGEYDYKVLDLFDLGIVDEIEETGTTFEENALLKAIFLYNRTGKIALGEDSGLEVAALLGRPGVYSARYAGTDRNDENNTRKVLEELGQDKPRDACFRTVIALFDGISCHYFEGVIHGKLADLPIGTGGFGYDPVFIPNGYSETFAQLPADTKNKISHRAMAVKKLLDYLIEKKHQG